MMCGDCLLELKCCDFTEFAKRIKRDDKKIVMFGAGVIGQVVAPTILNQLNLLEYVNCYVDNDTTKCGTIIKTNEKEFPVFSPDYLKQCGDSVIVLLNISRYSTVIEQLNKYSTDFECYIMPMMLINNFSLEKSKRESKSYDTPLIPKKLHYMWLGEKSIPDKLKRCISSWEKYCPDYEIIEWNEKNYDISKNEYMSQAYKCGAYGFVPDYARLDILYNHGGIYLDTDVEIIRPIDALLYQEAFCGVEKWQVVNFGGMSGAIKGHSMIKAFLENREQISFINEDGSQNRNTCGFYDTKVILDRGYKIDGTTQNICGMNVYASDYFHPYDYMSGITNLTENTYAIHHFNGGWLSNEQINENERASKLYQELLKKTC